MKNSVDAGGGRLENPPVSLVYWWWGCRDHIGSCARCDSGGSLQPGAVSVNVAVFDRPIPGGIEGLRATVKSMSALACIGSREEAITTLAHDLSSTRPLKTLENIFAFVTHNVHYMLDPVDVELVKSPTRTLLDRTGDCDDYSVLLAALLRASQIPTRFVVVRTNGHDFFNHVFPEASIDDAATWIALDATLPEPRVGKIADGILSRTTIAFRCPGGDRNG